MMNSVNLIGRLTAKPELSVTGSGKNYSRVRLAVNRRYKNQNGEREADFISVVLWGKLAETFTSYATKGLQVSIEGEIRARSFEDKKKERHYVTEILAQDFDLLESRAAVAVRTALANKSQEDVILEAEELPF